MAKNVSKKDLIALVAKKSDLSKAKTAEVVNSMIEEITNAVAKKKNVTLIGFGTFTTAKRAARTGRNPQTGKSLKIPAKTVPKFKPGTALKEAVAKKKK